MAKDSRSERERLKEEYKAHYRKMRETKERLARTRKTQNIAEALKNMDKSQMLDSFDDFLFTMKHKIASVEARLDVAMESLLEDPKVEERSLDEEMAKENARDTIRQVKLEMGLLYKEIEKQADSIKVNKTIGNGSGDGLEDQSDISGAQSSEDQS